MPNKDYFILMKLPIKSADEVRIMKVKESEGGEVQMSRKSFLAIANSRFKSIFHRWRAFYWTQFFTIFSYLVSATLQPLLRLPSRRQSWRWVGAYVCACVNQTTLSHSLPIYLPIIFLTIFHHHCHLLITNMSTFQPFTSLKFIARICHDRICVLHSQQH